MKKIALLCLFICLQVACDKVEDPIVNKLPPCTGGKPNYISDSNYSRSGYRKVLLEDYTGQTCPNCPAGTRVIKNGLVPRYQDTLIVLAVHQGNTFASPQPPKFLNDFRTDAGEAWGSPSGFGVSFYPAGIINRKKYTSSITLAYSAWTSNVPKGKAEPFVMQLDAKSVFETKCRSLEMRIKATIQQALSGNIRIIFGLVQDSIVGPQIDGSKEVEDYEFEHMFRGALNGSWGEDLAKGPFKPGDVIEKNMGSYAVPESVKGIPLDDSHVSIVVIAYDETSKEVLQAELLKLRPKGKNGI